MYIVASYQFGYINDEQRLQKTAYESKLCHMFSSTYVICKSDKYQFQTCRSVELKNSNILLPESNQLYKT